MSSGVAPPVIYVFVNGGEISHWNYLQTTSTGEDVFVKELIPYTGSTTEPLLIGRDGLFKDSPKAAEGVNYDGILEYMEYLDSLDIGYKSYFGGGIDHNSWQLYQVIGFDLVNSHANVFENSARD